MKKELEVKQNNQVAVTTEQVLSDWGVEAVNSSDIVIPQILAMQGLSDLVTDGVGKMGEFRDSVNGELLGSIDNPLEIIPFYIDKKWDIYSEKDGKMEWQQSISLIEDPLSPEYNDNLPWEVVTNGVKTKNVRRFNVFCLLPKEVEAGSSLPYYFSFKSTSMKEGKKLYTHMYVRNPRAKLTPASTVIKLGGVKTKNDFGTFIVPNVNLGRASTPQEVSECLQWLKVVKANKVKIHEDDMKTLNADDAPFAGQF